MSLLKKAAANEKKEVYVEREQSPYPTYTVHILAFGLFSVQPTHVNRR